MKKLQKSRVTFQKGKETKREAVGKARNIMDSVADNLVIDSEQAIKKAKDSKGGVQAFDVWEEVKGKKPAAKKPVDKE